MSESAAAKVCVDRNRVPVEELLHGMDLGVHRIAVNWWDGGVFEALD